MSQGSYLTRRRLVSYCVEIYSNSVPEMRKSGQIPAAGKSSYLILSFFPSLSICNKLEEFLILTPNLSDVVVGSFLADAKAIMFGNTEIRLFE
jgi:hypothetical protein